MLRRVSTSSAGVSDYETGTAGGTAGPNDPPCNPGGNGQPADSNGGGSVGLDQLTAAGGNPARGVVAEGCNGELFAGCVSAQKVVWLWYESNH